MALQIVIILDSSLNVKINGIANCYYFGQPPNVIMNGIANLPTIIATRGINKPTHFSVLACKLSYLKFSGNSMMMMISYLL